MAFRLMSRPGKAAWKQSEKDALDHYRKLQDIQAQVQEQNQQDLLDRTFVGLYKRQQTTYQQIEAENEHYSRQEADRSSAYEEGVQADRRHWATTSPHQNDEQSRRGSR